FRASLTFGASDGPVTATVGDFNGDSKLDLAVVNFNSNSVSVLLGNGDGAFQAPLAFVVGNPRSVAVGDFNGDGKPDLAVANINSNNVSVLLGNGDGTSWAERRVGVGVSATSLAVGDLNESGKSN